MSKDQQCTYTQRWVLHGQQSIFIYFQPKIQRDTVSQQSNNYIGCSVDSAGKLVYNGQYITLGLYCRRNTVGITVV